MLAEKQESLCARRLLEEILHIQARVEEASLIRQRFNAHRISLLICARLHISLSLSGIRLKVNTFYYIFAENLKKFFNKLPSGEEGVLQRNLE